jgi:hypothetical protein
MSFWLIYNRIAFLTVLEAGSPRTRWQPHYLVNAASLGSYLFTTTYGRWDKKNISGVSFIMSPIPFTRIPPSWSNHFSKALPWVLRSHHTNVAGTHTFTLYQYFIKIALLGYGDIDKEKSICLPEPNLLMEVFIHNCHSLIFLFIFCTPKPTTGVGN